MDAACRLPECPSDTAVYRKMAKDQEFAGIIARAREAQQHAIIDQTVDMADKATPENWQVVRLQIWARQWRAAKLAPKVYGEKTHHDVTVATDDLTPAERDARIEFLLAKQRARDALPATPTIDAEGRLVEAMALPANGDGTSQ